MNKHDRNKCLYESNWPMSQCVLGTVLSLAISLPIQCILASPSLSYLLLTGVALSIFVWLLLLRKSFFYQDHMIVYYPFRFVKRQIRIDYKEVSNFKFVDKPEGEFLELHIGDGCFFDRFCAEHIYSAMVSTRDKHKRMNFFFFLKYLKSVGYLIETNNKLSFGLTSIEERIGLVFGTGDLIYVRKSPHERRKEKKKNIIIIIITVLIGLLLGFLYPVRSGK